MCHEIGCDLGGIHAAEEKVGKNKYVWLKAKGENNGEQKNLGGNVGGGAGIRDGGCWVRA
jgi:hypothetical protein